MSPRNQQLDSWLEEDGVGAAIEDQMLLVAVRIANRNHDPARDVQVTHINLTDAALLKPAALPLEVGTIAGGKDAVLQLAFTRDRLVGSREYRLLIHGRSGAHDFELHCTIVLPVPEGKRVARRATAPVKHVSSVSEPGPRPPRLEPEAGDKHPPLPYGKFVGAQGAHGRPIGVHEYRGPEVLDYGGPGVPAPNTGVTLIRASSTYVGKEGPKDPTGSSVDLTARKSRSVTPLVVLSGNFYVQFSVDGGSTFTNLDPFKTFPRSSFPLDGLPQDEGLDGDYNLIYIPSINRIVWQLLTVGSPIDSSDPKGAHHWNRLRVAFASPQQFVRSGGTQWSHWDMTTAGFGLNNKEAFLDYPDIHYSAKSLFFTVAVNGGLLVIQVPLSDLQGGDTIHIGFTDPEVSKHANGARLVHYSPDAGYWARHGPQSNELTVYEWPEGSDIYTCRIVTIDTWYDDGHLTPGDFTSLTPDGTNWLEYNDWVVRGGTVQGEFKDNAGNVTRRIVFAWNAPRTNAVPQPHVRIQPILRKTYSGATEWSSEPSTDLWNADFAFNHAYLASNIKGEVGVSVGAGGGGTGKGDGVDATPVAGFLGDEKLYRMGVSTASTNKYGDYSAVRRHWPDQRYFSVFDYYTLATKPYWSGRAQYRMFARPADLGPPPG